MESQHRILRLLSNIYAPDTDPNADALDYETAQAIMRREATAGTLLQTLKARYAGMSTFLRVNPEEAEKYMLLVEMLAVEVPQQHPLPHKLRQAIKRPNLIETLVALLAPPFVPDQLALVRRGNQEVYAPIDIVLPDVDMTLTLTIENNEEDDALRDLMLTTDADDARLIEWEGTLLRLLGAEQAASEAEIDEFGDATFFAIAPGSYELHWRFEQDNYAIQKLSLP